MPRKATPSATKGHQGSPAPAAVSPHEPQIRAAFCNWRLSQSKDVWSFHRSPKASFLNPTTFSEQTSLSSCHCPSLFGIWSLPLMLFLDMRLKIGKIECLLAVFTSIQDC